MSFDYFYGQQSDLFTFYRVPKVLFTNERFWNISADAKMLYGILLDRMSLSAKNGWIDKNGRVYIIFTIDEAKMALNCAEQKAIKLLSELEKKAGLIERKRQGLGKPNLIYVKNFISAVDSQLLNCENHNSGTMEITTQELPKSQCNNTDIKNTEFSDTDSIFPSGNGGMMDENDRYQECFDYFSDQLSMDLLKKDYPYDSEMLDNILELIVETVCTKRPLIRIGAEERPAEIVRSRFMKLNEKFKKDNPDAASNPISRWKQKQAIKKEYAAAKAGKGTAKETAAKATKKAAQSTKTITEKAMEFCTTHSKTILFVLIAGLLFMILSGMFSSCSAMFQGGTQIVLGTSFTAKEEDIIGADNDYKALEAALRNEINNIERTHSGYDEYRYDLDEINHNPYELAAYLTVKFEDYTRDEVQATLQWLFEQQYELTLTEVVEIRTRTTSSTDPGTGETTTEEEDYEYYILKVKLRNKGLNSVISNSGLSEDDMERYRILLQTRGNRPDIFGNDIYATPGGEYTDYDIPGEALTDTRFANMIREAEKYLGYPYVWGGSSPSSSFDCSGFVSWVINNCGNGWSVGRLTANGLMGVCDIIPKSSAKPGDLIFFQGTYDTSGASHVGIYVGNGMMIHCGNPISYASIESNYWQQHFYCFGRIRN